MEEHVALYFIDGGLIFIGGVLARAVIYLKQCEFLGVLTIFDSCNMLLKIGDVLVCLQKFIDLFVCFTPVGVKLGYLDHHSLAFSTLKLLSLVYR